MEKFNFGENFVNVIKLCYNNIESTVINNGFSCGWFQLERGMRQGCPLSGFVFLFAAEILGQMVRNDESINGIHIEGIELKLSQFADDATCFLSDWQSVINLFLLARTFRELSGLSLSENKTLLIWLGPWRIKERNPLNLPQSGDCFNVWEFTWGEIEILQIK